jgi:hypothetical protein
MRHFYFRMGLYQCLGVEQHDQSAHTARFQRRAESYGTVGGSGHEIAPNPKTLKNLIDRYGVDKLHSFLKEIDLYDGNYKTLTEPEARALRRAPSLDEA